MLAVDGADETPTCGDDQCAGDVAVGVRRMCDDVAAALPVNYTTADVRSRLQRLGALQPTNAFLRREIDRMQSVISTVDESVRALRQLVDGHAAAAAVDDDDALRQTFDAVRDARVPPVWTKVSYLQPCYTVIRLGGHQIELCPAF